MKKILIGTFLAAFSGMVLLSCDSDDPSIGRTAGQEIAGEWWVTYSVDGEDAGGGYSEIITSNTAANVNTEMLLSDFVNPTAAGGNFWTYKIKTQIDPTSKKFSADEVTSTATPGGELYDIKVNVLNGQIFIDGGKSRTGVKTDSIYFEIQFEDDTTPFATTFVVQGHRRTGFTEDDF
ncbi:lipid-binding protein [Dawidia soli]|uniref:Lipid-binding hydrolase n=1 Tax=Dawidia soli TaxID=2782352 RepID=A0AAP2DAL3_9BACT|nr:lipid-binding protein [Dawidia soli]MBT1685767.1 hypothetical protein [Dawidia soli]